MVNPYNETLLNNKKEWNVDTSNKKDESQNNYSESKEDRQKKEYVLYDSIYVTF